MYQTRVKLYAMEGNAWKERGVGALKLNKKRADGTHARLGKLVVAKAQILVTRANTPQ